jgi:ribosomal protein L28
LKGTAAAEATKRPAAANLRKEAIVKDRKGWVDVVKRGTESLYTVEKNGFVKRVNE